jgi:hypothetical protein
MEQLDFKIFSKYPGRLSDPVIDWKSSFVWRSFNGQDLEQIEKP